MVFIFLRETKTERTEQGKRKKNTRKELLHAQSSYCCFSRILISLFFFFCTIGFSIVLLYIFLFYIYYIRMLLFRWQHVSSEISIFVSFICTCTRSKNPHNHPKKVVCFIIYFIFIVRAQYDVLFLISFALLSRFFHLKRR